MKKPPIREKRLKRIIDQTMKRMQTSRDVASIVVKKISCAAVLLVSDLLFLAAIIFLDGEQTRPLWWCMVVIMAVFLTRSLYVMRFSFVGDAYQIFKGLLISLLIIMAVLFFKETGIPKIVFFLFSLSLFIFMPAEKYLAKLFIKKLGIWKKGVIIIGTGTGRNLAIDMIERCTSLGYIIEGILTTNAHATATHVKGYPVLGGIDYFKTKKLRNLDKDVVIALPDMDKRSLSEMVRKIRRFVGNIRTLPDIMGLPTSSYSEAHHLEKRADSWILINEFGRKQSLFIKRIFDLVVSVLSLPIIVPILFFAAIAIRLTSKGPAFYTDMRVGQGEKVFDCYKLRSMFVDSDKMLEGLEISGKSKKGAWWRVHKIKGDDPRVTSIGKFLRITSLDELPQIFNVIKGEMSLVGPRPRHIDEKIWYRDIVLSVPPGLTGLWQVSGRSDIPIDEKSLLDNYYAQRRSLLLDIILILKTLKVLVREEGAY